jgi:hypothetical protein
MERQAERRGDPGGDATMNCTIDASVFVSAVRLEETHYAVSRRFLESEKLFGIEDQAWTINRFHSPIG